MFSVRSCPIWTIGVAFLRTNIPRPNMKATITKSEDVQLKFEEEKTELEENIKLHTNKIGTITESLNSNRTDLQSALAETTQEQEELESNRSVIFDKMNMLSNDRKTPDSTIGMSIVNIERSLKFGDEIGGHLMSGHVCCECQATLNKEGGEMEIVVNKPKDWGEYIIPKGYVALNGVSLTVGKVTEDKFSVFLISVRPSRESIFVLITLNVSTTFSIISLRLLIIHLLSTIE